MLTADDVPALSAGATLLGSGGGGAVGLGVTLLHRLLDGASVPVRPAARLDRTAGIVHVGVAGAPDVMAERLLDPADLAVAVHAVADRSGVAPAAVGIIEIGGLNALVGVLTAAQLGIPVVDGDLMGRAFPSIRMTSLAVAGHAHTPMAVVSPAGDVVTICASARTAERQMTSAVGAMGGAAAVALHPCTAGVLSDVAVSGSLSECLRLGWRYLGARAEDPHAVVTALGGRPLLDGRVDEVVPPLGDEPGSITVTDLRGGATARIDHYDEFVAVSRDGVPVARSPEVIVALDSRTCAPLRADQIRPGHAVTLCSLDALHPWPAGTVDPPAFGLDPEVVR